MIDAAIYWMWPDVFMGHTMYGDDVVPGALIYQIYRLQQTADGHLVYFAASDGEVFGLFDALGHPEWKDDSRFDGPAKRQETENFEALGALLHNAFLTFTTNEIMERLANHEVPAARVNSVDEVFSDPQIVHNQLIQEWEHPDAGTIKMARPPVRWSVTSPAMAHQIDHLGQSTDEVLAAHGFDDDARRRLRQAGIIPAAPT